MQQSRYSDEVEICSPSAQLHSSLYSLYSSEQTSSEPESPDFFLGTTGSNPPFLNPHGLTLEDETHCDYQNPFEPTQLTERNYLPKKIPSYTYNSVPEFYLSRSNLETQSFKMEPSNNEPLHLTMDFRGESGEIPLPSMDPKNLYFFPETISNCEVRESLTGVNSNASYDQPPLIPGLSSSFNPELALNHTGTVWNMGGIPRIPPYQTNTCYFTIPCSQERSSDPRPYKKKPRTSSSKKPTDNRKCSNCHCTNSPSWRRCEAGQMLLCNACGLYQKLHHRPRPWYLSSNGQIKVLRSTTYHQNCAHCGTRDTPMWRRGEDGQVLCNACGLFMKQHNVPRQLHNQDAVC